MKRELHPDSNNIKVIFTMHESEIVELDGVYNFLHRQCNAKAYSLCNTVPCIT